MTTTSSDIQRKLASGNARFAATVDKALLASLQAGGQPPLVAILTCADSRIDPARIFGLSLGQAFVVRNAGNSVADLAALGSLEYAVSKLKVKALLVMGHTDCGAVAASYEIDQNPNLGAVMRDLECAKSKLGPDSSRDCDRVSEANIRFQMRRLLDISSTIRLAVQNCEIELIGAMYQLSSGKVKFID